MTCFRFIDPLDVLFLRGNKLFGDPGSFGESLIPPWPSVVAGALRSWLLAVDGIDFGAFARGEQAHPTLGTPSAPGPFAVTTFQLAREVAGRIETLHAPPADLVIHADGDSVRARRLAPVRSAQGLASSASLPSLPVLPESDRRKPAVGYWLTQQGFARHLLGETVEPEDLVKAETLWSIDHRVGVGLDAELGRADDGKLFSMQAVALRQGVGFLVGVTGADLPARGMIRFGGDGRAAAVRPANYEPAAIDAESVRKAGRCRLMLTTPGLFAEGWRLPGMSEDGRFDLAGVRGRIVAAAVARAELVSGFDLAQWMPKPAQRVAPTGSTYWIDDLDAEPGALGKLAESGLWDAGEQNSSRRVEGFNQIAFATY